MLNSLLSNPLMSSLPTGRSRPLGTSPVQSFLLTSVVPGCCEVSRPTLTHHPPGTAITMLCVTTAHNSRASNRGLKLLSSWAEVTLKLLTSDIWSLWTFGHYNNRLPNTKSTHCKLEGDVYNEFLTHTLLNIPAEQQSPLQSLLLLLTLKLCRRHSLQLPPPRCER